MAKRLTDAEKKKILADFIESQNLSEAARVNGVSRDTVRRLLRETPEIVQILQQKKEKDTENILAYMDGKASSVKRFCDYVLEERLNPQINRSELDSLSIPQLATVFGVALDKALKVRELSIRSGEDAELEDTQAIADEVDRDE